MFGLILAVLYVAYQLIFGNGQMSTEDAFLNASHFLFWWYVVVYAILVPLVAAVCVLVPVAGAAAGSQKVGGAAGAFGGFLLGGGVSILLLVLFAIRVTMFVGGAYLLMTSGEYGATWGDFSVAKMVTGGILLLVGILTRSHASSKKSDD